MLGEAFKSRWLPWTLLIGVLLLVQMEKISVGRPLAVELVSAGEGAPTTAEGVGRSAPERTDLDWQAEEGEVAFAALEEEAESFNAAPAPAPVPEVVEKPAEQRVRQRQPVAEADKHPFWVVVTSINPPTDQVKKLAATDGWKVLVVGDKKSPPEWAWDNCVFLSAAAQEELGYAILDFVPYNHYGRKNIGYIYAIEHGAQVIYDTDDDNVPMYGPVVMTPERFPAAALQAPADATTEPPSMCNPYAQFGYPEVWPRGYPVERIEASRRHPCVATSRGETASLVPIQQGLADLDPDVDAIYRLTHGSELGKIVFDPAQPAVALPAGTFTPFNSQNTVFHQSAFWALMIPVTTTFRVCDIWRGYWAQRLLWDIGGELMFLQATVEQVRNAHNYLADFEDEIDLYTQSGKLTRFLHQWQGTGEDIFERAVELAGAMADAGFWERGDADLAAAWVEDLRLAGVQPPPLMANGGKPTSFSVQASEGSEAGCMALSWGAAGDGCEYVPVVTPQLGLLPATRGLATEVCGLNDRTARFSAAAVATCPSGDATRWSDVATFSSPAVSSPASSPPPSPGGEGGIKGRRLYALEPETAALTRDLAGSWAAHTDLDVANGALVLACLTGPCDDGPERLLGDAFVPSLSGDTRRRHVWRPTHDEAARLLHLAQQEDSIDAFVCSGVPSLCALFAGAGKPIVIRAGSRIDRWGDGDPEALKAWVAALEALHERSDVVVAATNEYDVQYVRHFFGWTPVRWFSFAEHVPSTAHYAPTKRTVLVGSPGAQRGSSSTIERLFAEAQDAVTDRNSTTKLELWGPSRPTTQAAAFRAVILFPEDVYDAAVTELYAMGVPLFVPGVHLAARLHREMGLLSQKKGAMTAAGYPASAESALGHHPDDPEATEAQLAEWLKFGDLWRWPHVQTFDTWVELFNIIDGTEDSELEAIGQAMRAHFATAASESKAEWGPLVSRVLSPLPQGVADK